MPLSKYFKKTSNTVIMSQGSVFQPKDDETWATEVETGVVPIASKSGKNLKCKSKTVSSPKCRRWNNDYGKYGFYCATGNEHSQYSTVDCLFCPVKYANLNLVHFKLNLQYILKNNIPNTNSSSRSFSSLNYLHFNSSKEPLNCK